MITEKEFEYIEKELEESFAYTLHDKLIFITGLLSEDKELEPILNFINYLLYKERSEPTSTLSLTPSVDFSNFLSTDEAYRKCNREKCKSCTEYKKDVLSSRCKNCKYFSQWNIQDLYSSIEVKNAK